MANVVDYVLNLKDQMSPVIDGATGHVKKMEGALGGVKSMALSVGAALGAAFGVYQIIQFGKESFEAFHQLEQATAKVEANLTATGEKAGMSLKEIQNFSKGLASHIQATQSEVTDMASQLLTFPSITKDVFQQSMGLVADIAKQTGHGLSETGIMYGKALNSPIEGLQKMQRYGVIFSEEEKKRITQLQQSGHLILAQKEMMKDIAGSGYAGVAQKMFDADPVARFNKLMETTKLSVGEYATQILGFVMPALEGFVKGVKVLIEKIKEFSDWVIRNKRLLGDILIVIGAVTLAIGTMAIITNWTAIVYWGFGIALNAVTLATSLATAATWLFSAALWSTGIPEVVIAVAALTIGILKLTHHFGGFGNALAGTWQIIKAFAVGAGKAFWGLGEIIAGALSFSPKLIAKGLTDTVNAVRDAGKNINDAWNNSDAQAAAKASKTKSLIPGKDGELGATGKQAEEVKTPATKAEGQKTINIHVAYNAPLISGFTISTTNIKEGLQDLKEMVSKILVDATHDSLMVADY